MELMERMELNSGPKLNVLPTKSQTACFNDNFVCYIRYISKFELNPHKSGLSHLIAFITQPLNRLTRTLEIYGALPET